MLMNKYIIYSFQIISLIIFISLIPILLILNNGTSLVWTFIIPFVPLFILAIGYSNWRKICPLAFFANLSQRFTFIQKRKVPKWYEKNLYLLQFTILLIAFAARLVLLNYDAIFLTLFFILVILSAFIINSIYTGKTWCNFFCPVGLVEKIYCGSNANNSDNNSKCTTCTGCKSNCPDIDMENNYWKEKENPQQSFAFYSFSGLVLGFYAYFYLQTGSYQYYFDGIWSSIHYSALSQGFFFAPYIPLIIAAPLTLIIFSIVSYYIFKSIENYIWEYKFFSNLNYQSVRHRVRIVSGFVAFNIFYAFAGAPTFNLYPTFYSIFHFTVVLVSAIILHKEFFKTDSGYVIDRFTMKMIKKLDPSKNQTYKEQLEIYKKSLYELFEDGIINHDDVLILEELREKVGISHADHYNTLRGIKLLNDTLFDDNIKHSPERRYQINSYKSMIENALEEHQQLDDSILASLQKQFAISNEDHKIIIDTIINSNTKLKHEVLELIDNMKYLITTHNSIFNDSSIDVDFLKYTIKKEFNEYSDDLFILLDIIYDDFHQNSELFKKVLKYHEFNDMLICDGNTLKFMDNEISNSILDLINELKKINSHIAENNNFNIIMELINHKSIILSTVALLTLKNYSLHDLSNINYDKFINSNDTDIISVVNKVMNNGNELTLFDKMKYIHNVPIFSTIKFDELYQISKSINTLEYKAGIDIIKQGDDGNSLYIIISGEVDVYVDNHKVNRLSTGDHFGDIAIIADTNRTATISTVTDCETLELSEDNFKNIIYENPNISFSIMKEITNKLLDNSKIYKK